MCTLQLNSLNGYQCSTERFHLLEVDCKVIVNSAFLCGSLVIQEFLRTPGTAERRRDALDVGKEH